MSNSEFRKIEFQSFDEVIAEAKVLLEGHVAHGNWNYVQTCHHLANWMRFPVEGFPKSGFPLNFMLWILKLTMGKGMIRKILANRAMKAGSPTMPQSISTPDASSEAEALQELEAAIQQFRNHSGEYIPSPLFGQLDRKKSEQLQLIHCAHHFGFLAPRS